mgnify:FL=1
MDGNELAIQLVEGGQGASWRALLAGKACFFLAEKTESEVGRGKAERGGVDLSSCQSKTFYL